MATARRLAAEGVRVATTGTETVKLERARAELGGEALGRRRGDFLARDKSSFVLGTKIPF